MPSFRQWLIGFAVYSLFGIIAIGIVVYADMLAYSTPVLFIFLLGYLGGRLSKMIESL